MLKIRGLRKQYGKHIAVDGVDLDVRRGETVVIMGPSGCGKSTMIRCVNRLTEPDAGEILVDGKSILSLDDQSLREFRRTVGFVFQQFNLIARLNVLDNVMFHLVLAGVPREQAEARARKALAKVGLESSEHKHPANLSGGEQQRVGIARALASNPQLMLWDEPTASLDPILIGEVLDVMEELVRTTNTTSIIVTHEVGFALKVADRIILMDKGKVVEEGSPRAIFADPQSEVGKKYQRLIAS
ncbi:MAG: amino acid ABC transporter ATP-binding protein [Limnochordia bacterium]|nr:amino acid ABC transporter ATP-binding protein [Bacillota bacterium]HOB08871.1 amino acid ABC transporter ATP-binding protein [Limnochordia bacterium]NLH30626.1 amino acid ABC transporter ATP-binding protein [Bacillota bacterium]HPZ31039.1 amino acid ABC transporter ATP-binding protein [Limnochordia bacterium]HQD69782.1 amino acid ABC transporter ATP-binding protein [Limnochordia bacterium]